MTSETVLPAAAVQRAINHMNEDHRDSLLEMARALAGCPWAIDAELVAVDALGVNVRASGEGREEMARIARCRFVLEPVTAPGCVQQKAGARS